VNKHPIQDLVSDLLLSWLFAFCLLWGAYQSLQYQFSPGLTALYLLAFLLIWILILRVQYVFLAAMAILFFITFFWAIPTIRDPDRFYLLVSDWTLFAAWIGDAAVFSVPDPPGNYLHRAVLLMSLGAALAVGTLVRTRVHPVVFLLLGGGMYFAQEVFLSDLYIPAFFLYLCALALYTLRQSYIRRRRRVHRAAPPMRALAGAVPLCILAALLALLLPSRNTPLGEPILDMFSLSEDTPLILEHFSYGGLKRRDGGDELGGPLRQNNTLLLTIDARHATYLRAHTYDAYTGRSWRNAHDVNEPYRALSRHYRLGDPYRGLQFNFGLPSLIPLHGTLGGGYQLLTGAVLWASQEIERGADSLPPPLDGLFELSDSEGVLYSSSGGVIYSSREIDDDITITEPFSGAVTDVSPLTSALQYNKQTITFQNLRSNSLFLPQGAVDVTLWPKDGAGDPGPLVLSTLGDMKMNRSMGKAFGYDAETCDLNLSRAELGDLLRQSGWHLIEGEEGGEETVIYDGDGVPHRIILSGEGVLENLRSYARWEYVTIAGMPLEPWQSAIGTPWQPSVSTSDELKLPDSVPERVYELAYDLTRDRPTIYDKALAIETWLRGSFPYDTEVPATPPGRDFVDYFLFDLQRGYCTYYATSMVVLCRAVGIPARYVEGFAPAPDPVANAPGRYVATGEEAHAWCEVFFPGFGWIPFEPTASLGDSFESRHFGGNLVLPTQTPMIPYDPLDLQSPSYFPSAAPQDPGTDAGWTPPRWLVNALTAVLLLGAVPPVHGIRRRLTRRAGRAPVKAAQRQFARSVRLAQCLGVPQPHLSETPLEWARRADKTLYAKPDMSFLPAAERYSTLRYGPGAVTRQDLEAFYALREKLHSQWTPRIFIVKYVVWRHFLGWI